MTNRFAALNSDIMMKLDLILASWAKDSKIQPDLLDSASLAIPVLHSKYLTMYTTENLSLKKRIADIAQLELAKWEYYSGTMSTEDLKDRGWPQFDRRVLKADVPKYIAADDDMVKALLTKELQKEKVDALKEIIRSINNRTFVISNAIKWHQYRNGVG